MRKLSFLVVMVLLVTGGVMVWWQNGMAAADPFDTSQKKFVIQKGEGVREIANDLKSEGLIKDPVVFFLLVKMLEADGKIQAGEFNLSPSMDAQTIMKTLQVGTFDIQITIPEGKRAEEVAEIIQGHFPAYEDSWREKLMQHEGHLFPDTYSFAQDTSIDLIISTMNDNFEQKYGTIPDGKKDTLNKEEIVILASLIEREAKYHEDRPLVASVLLNRLKSGMPLQVDATIQYALGYQPAQKTWWKKDLTVDEDLKINSPFNTYLNAGLPPQPIANPGLEALKAVIDAPATDYMYYISDNSGENHYAVTYEEHKKNIEKFGL